jgi:transposase
VIGLGAATRIYLAVGVTDLRKSFDGLYGIVEEALALDPMSGALFVFCNRTRNRLKVLYWDGSGLCVLAKRLEQGTFRWPSVATRCHEVSRAELELLISGLDLASARERKWYRRTPEPKQCKISAC